MSQSLKLSVHRPTSRHELQLYSKSSHSLFLSFMLPSSISPSFSFFSRAHPLVVNSCFLSTPLLTTRSGVSATVVCTPRSVRYWQSGERHFHRERPLFLELHRFTCCVWSWIPNPHRRYTFICSSASYARRLSFRSAFVRTSWPSIAVVVAKAGCGCRLVHGKELTI